MIALSAPTFDPLGHIRLPPLPSSDIGSVRRRVSRQRTLDTVNGTGVVVNDGGFVHGDRTFRLRWRPRSAAEYDQVARLLRLYPQVYVAARDGFYRAAPSDLNQRNGEADLSLLVIERME